MIGLYALACAYTLLWIFFRRIRRLGGFLVKYQRDVKRYVKGLDLDKERQQQLIDVYGGIKSPDVQLLLDLLAETMGIEVSIRILTLLDEDFHQTWRVMPRHGVRQLFDTFSEILFQICSS